MNLDAPPTTIVDVIEARAATHPEEIAIASGEARISYGALSARSAAIAAALAERGLGAERRVGVYLSRGAALPIAMLGAWKAGACYVPLDPAHPRERIRRVVEIARLDAVITEAGLASMLPPEVPRIDVDAEGARAAATPEIAASSAAYLIFTSGSSGSPKGVVVEHRGLPAMAAAQREAFAIGAGDRLLQLASPSFDAHVFELVMALASGATLVVPTLAETAPGPALARTLRAQAITHLVILPSVLSLLPAEDLPALRVLVSCGEACPPALAERWAAGRRFFNAYGPTETTIWATLHEHRAPGPVPIGAPIAGVTVEIVDEGDRPADEGELLIGGAGVARGYLDDPALTAARFVEDASGARRYRSGDRVRRRGDGALEFLGRVDAQLKIRGARVEPGEVEAALAAHPEVREVAVGGGDERAPGEQRLVAWVALRSPAIADGAALRAFLADRLPAALVPSRFVMVEALPRTASGKVDRRALPAPSAARAAGAAWVAPRSETERVIAAIFAEVLGLPEVSAEDDFFALGGDSLRASRVMARVAHEAFHVDLGLADLLSARTVRALAERVASAAPAVEAIEAEGPPRLSFAQERALFLHQLDPGGAALHLPALIRIRGPLSAAYLRGALAAIIARHEALRTVFDGAAEVRVVDAAPLALGRVDLPEADDEALLRLAEEEAARPFDLSRAPLLRATLVRLAAEDHALVLVAHHLVADGASLRVILAELAALHAELAADRGPSLPPTPRFGAHAARERHPRTGERRARAIEHFREALAGAPAAATLPRPEAPSPSGAGARLAIALPASSADPLAALARAEGATPFMALLALWALALADEGAGDDLVIATPLAGRDRPELEGAIGCYADLVPVRVRVPPTYRALLREVRARMIGAAAHGEAPFSRLVEALSPAREAGRLPIAQIMFAFDPAFARTDGADGVRWELAEIDLPAASFDLTLRLRGGADGGAEGALIYRADRVDPAAAARLAASFARLAAEVAAAPDAPRATGVTDAEIEAALLADPLALDAAARTRSSGERVAYVAWAGAARLDLGRLPPRLRPGVVARVAALPIGEDGRVDEAALSRLPVLDEALAARVEADLGDAAAAVLPREEPLPILRRPPRARLATTPESAALALPEGPPAIADGGPLVLRGDAPRTLGEALIRAARGPRGILWTTRAERAFQSYAELLEEARRVVAGLRVSGLSAGDRALILASSGRAEITAFWGAVLAGVVPAIVSLGLLHTPGGVDRLRATWERLGRPLILADRGTLAAAREIGPLQRLDELADHPPASAIHEARPEDDAYLQRSSGTTGAPKIIRETHAAILRHHHAVARFNGYGPEDVTLNWLPFDHVGALLGWHLKDVVFGSAQVQAPTDEILAEPLRFLDLLDEHRITHSWAPNFAWKRVVDGLAGASAKRWDLSAVRALVNGGEQVTAPVARAFLDALAPFGLRRGALEPSFGMAECCTGITYHHGFDPDRGARRLRRAALRAGVIEPAGEDDGDAATFVDLGPPVPGARLRIAASDGRVLPERAVGRLQIAGDFVTPGYLGEDGAGFTGDGWLDTGDLGFLDGGRLTLTGREKEQIIVRGQNLGCAEIEEVATSAPGVAAGSVIACALDDAEAGTESAVIFFAPVDPAAEAPARAAISARLGAELGLAPAGVVAIAEADVPRTSAGKVRRAELARAFAEGRFPRGAALPDWFFERTFRRRELGPRAPDAAGSVLVMLDEAGLGETLVAALRARGRRVTAIDAAAAPRDADAARRLLEASAPLDAVVHLATWGPPSSASASDVFGLLPLGAALGAAALPAPLRLLVVGSGTQRAAPGDDLDPDRALVLGLLAGMPAEIAGLDARHVDLPGGDPAIAASIVLDELAAARRDREVAYRAGARLVQRLTRADLGPSAPIPEGSAWLVTGGLGALGQPLVRHLLARSHARLLIVGRTPLEARRAELAALEDVAARSGGEVIYAAADVADEGALRAAVTAAEARWGRRIDGALHLAGTFRRRLLATETAADLAEALRCKVQGARALAAILDERPGSALLAFSSIAGTLGGWGVAAHAAGSRFLEHFVEARAAAGAPARCLSWAPWDERRPASAPGESGLSTVSAELGVASFDAALAASSAVTLIGLDPRSRAVQGRAGDADRAPEALVIWAARDLGPIELRDRFGAPVPVEIRRVEQLPRTPAGAVDRAALLGRAEPPPPDAAPQSDEERAIAAVFCEVLRREAVGLDDNFFDLGGHSLLLAEVRARLSRLFEREIPIVDLFRHPTVAALARHVAGQDPVPSRAASRAARQRAAVERMTPRRARRSDG